MKKIFIFLFLIITSVYAFSEEFSLFPWFTSQKDIYDYCIKKGWSYSADTSSKVPSFSFIPSKDVTYHNTPVYNIHFMFNENGIVVNQAVTFDNILDAAASFPAILNYLIMDNAQLSDKTIQDNDIIMITYNATINNKVKADYIIYGKNNAFQLSISYHVY